jgi:hypothetical protein
MQLTLDLPDELSAALAASSQDLNSAASWDSSRVTTSTAF